jgi:Ca2+-transporting ATPase
LADWFKDKQFVELSKIIKEENIPVIRGKAGASQSLSVWDIKVGDIVVLNTGQGVPADCLVIESVDLKVDNPKDPKVQQTEFDTGKRKSANDDPFLKAGSLVVRGQAKAVVCAVGENSSRGIKEPKLEVSDDTPIQIKLTNLRNRFTCFAIIASFMILVSLIVMFIINMGTAKSWFDVVLDKLPKSANIVVVMFVVIVPEGLPLTVGVSLAFTVMRMYHQDKILVRNLEAPETMGMINELLVGKTGTLTQGNMKVSKFLCEGQVIKNTRKNTLT